MISNSVLKCLEFWFTDFYGARAAEFFFELWSKGQNINYQAVAENTETCQTLIS